MMIHKSIDVEDAVREILAPHMTAFCRPLPENPALPCVLAQRVGGVEKDTVDSAEIVLDARAATEAQADDTLRTAVAILRAAAQAGDTPIRYVSVNASGGWGQDPMRPELAMCSARLTVYTHLQRINI